MVPTAAREEIVALREEFASELERCRLQQEAQLAALAGGREALSEQLDETFRKLQRARQEIEEKTREFDARSAGSRETTQALCEVQSAGNLEVEKMLAAGALRITAAEQERETLLRLREYVREMFKQVCFARNDFAKVSAEHQLKTREFSELEERVKKTEQELATRTAERDARQLECVAACAELTAAREAAAKFEDESAALREQLQAMTAREEELVGTVAQTEEKQRRGAELAQAALAQAQGAIAVLRDDLAMEQLSREDETGRLAAQVETLDGRQRRGRDGTREVALQTGRAARGRAAGQPPVHASSTPARCAPPASAKQSRRARSSAAHHAPRPAADERGSSPAQPAPGLSGLAAVRRAAERGRKKARKTLFRRLLGR